MSLSMKDNTWSHSYEANLVIVVLMDDDIVVSVLDCLTSEVEIDGETVFLRFVLAICPIG